MIPKFSNPLNSFRAPAQKKFEVKFGTEIEMRDITRRRAAEIVAEHLPGSRIVEIRTKGNNGFVHDDYEVIDNQKRVWQVKDDHPCLVELATPILKRRRDLDKLKEIATALKAEGATTPKHTGMHFHVNGSSFSPRNATNLLVLMAQHEWHLYESLGIHEVRREWCEPLNRFAIDRLTGKRPINRGHYGAMYTDQSWAGKNKGVNMRNFSKPGGTIEFRYFNASLDADEIEANHAMVMSMAKYARRKMGRAKLGEHTEKHNYEKLCKTLNLTPRKFTAAVPAVNAVATAIPVAVAA